MNTIEVKNLTKKFGKYTAVDNINLTVQKGSIYGFLRPNGSGKSTTIRMLCGVLSKTSGSAKIFDYDVTKNTKMIKNKIGYMSQKFSLYDDLTINENLNFYGGIYGLDKNRLEEQKKYILEMADLQKEVTF